DHRSAGRLPRRRPGLRHGLLRGWRARPHHPHPADPDPDGPHLIAPAVARYSILRLSAAMVLAHRARSAAVKVANASGVMARISMPTLFMRSTKHGLVSSVRGLRR